MSRRTTASLLGFLVLSMFALTGCSSPAEPVDYKAQTCSSVSDLLDAYTVVPAPDDFSDIEAANAILAANLAVWKSESGATDPTFKLVSKFAGKMLVFLSEGSPTSAQNLIDFEKKSGSDLLENCGITSIRYVKPLEIDGGCWNNSTVSAELQERVSGKWTRTSFVYELSKTSNCSDVEGFPWGVNFKITRGWASDANESEYNQEYRIVWTDSEGYSFDDGTYTHYSCVEKTTSEDDYLQLWWECS